MHKSVYGFQMAQYAVNRVFFRAVHFAWKKPSGGFNVKSSVQKASLCNYKSIPTAIKSKRIFQKCCCNI